MPPAALRELEPSLQWDEPAVESPSIPTRTRSGSGASGGGLTRRQTWVRQRQSAAVPLPLEPLPLPVAEPVPSPAERRRRRRLHQPVRISLRGALVALIALGQVAMLLLLQTWALQAHRAADKLDREIENTSQEIAAVQERIASYDSAPLVATWASHRGWRLATQSDFDSITQPRPLPPPAASPAAPEVSGVE